MTRITSPFLLLVSLLLVNLCLWGLAALTSLHNLAMISTALLAWIFGARHALDADHITAIDTITRRLMERGQKPYMIGLYFSLGHSTIVILATILLIALPSSSLFEWLHLRGGVIGGLVAGGFLLIMGILTARSAWQQFWRLKESRLQEQAGFSALKHSYSWRGWQVILLGMLFGLGFDTASEISLLSLTTARHVAGQAFWACLLLPLLFTGAMALIDSLDNLLMIRAWSDMQGSTSRRRGQYRLNVTILSSVIAFFIGGMELGALTGIKTPSLLALLEWCADHGEELGGAIIALFLLLWAGYGLSSRRTSAS